MMGEAYFFSGALMKIFLPKLVIYCSFKILEEYLSRSKLVICFSFMRGLIISLNYKNPFACISFLATIVPLTIDVFYVNHQGILAKNII